MVLPVFTNKSLITMYQLVGSPSGSTFVVRCYNVICFLHPKLASPRSSSIFVYLSAIFFCSGKTSLFRDPNLPTENSKSPYLGPRMYHMYVFVVDRVGWCVG